jgi:hypothetical protein
MPSERDQAGVEVALRMYRRLNNHLLARQADHFAAFNLRGGSAALAGTIRFLVRCFHPMFHSVYFSVLPFNLPAAPM